MTILIAPDSFKGNLSAPAVCAAIEEGIRRADGGAVIRKIPLADGGEGTARAITEAAGGSLVKVRVRGPLGDPGDAEFGLLDGGCTAVLDIAAAIGIGLLPRERLNPMEASSCGAGELIAAALDRGAREIIIGLGGSATSDGGLGMLNALGFRFLDEGGNAAGQGGAALERIALMDPRGADPRLRHTRIRAACDVTNPLLGEMGAARVFGPQKGASPEMTGALDRGLTKLADIWIQAGLTAGVEEPGDGAAGGIGAALRVCLGARIESGALLVMEYAGFFKSLEGADLVITGEGKTDGQTAGGKLCSAVAQECRRAGVPAALLSGALEEPAALLEWFDYAASISQGQESLEAMIRDSRRDLAFAAENLIRAMRLNRRHSPGRKF